MMEEIREGLVDEREIMEIEGLGENEVNDMLEKNCLKINELNYSFNRIQKEN